MSQEMKQWCVGTKVEWKGPFGGIEYQHNQVLHTSSYALYACLSRLSTTILETCMSACVPYFPISVKDC